MDGNISLAYLQTYIRAMEGQPTLLHDTFLKLTEELGTLSRTIRKGLHAHDPKELEGTVDEALWDTLYYVLAIANIYDISMEQVIKNKTERLEDKYIVPVKFVEGR